MKFQNQPFYIKLVIFGLLIMLGVFVANAIVLAVYPDVLHGQMDASTIKLNQALAQLFMFVVPTLVFSYLISSGPKRYYNLHAKINWVHVAYTVLFFFLINPIVTYATLLNQQMVLPEFLEGVETWMREKEDDLAAITEQIAMATTIPALLVNLVIMAVLPAIGEELFFRGFIQKYMFAWIKNTHVTIWVVAFLFSAFHVQFYGFLPRLLMGAALGYIFVWTRNMWMPILYHFINNALATVAYYLYAKGDLETQPEHVGVWENPSFLLINAAALTFLIIYFYRKRNNDVDWPIQMGEL